MSDEIISLREELAALRAEFTELKKEHRKLLRMVGILPLDEGEKWPEYLHIECNAFAVRDGPMKIPIIMRAEGGDAYITFMDGNHIDRLKLSLDGTGPLIELRNAKGKLIFQVAEAADGSGQLCVCDAEGAPRAGMRVSEHGGLLNVLDKSGKPQAFLTCAVEGGEVHVASAAHRNSAAMKATVKGGLITVSEPSGQLMGFLMGSSDAGQVSVYGPHGAQAVGISGTAQGGGIIFYDLDGEPKAHLPEQE